MASVTSNLLFPYQETMSRQHMTNDFEKEISSLKTKSADVDQLKKAYRKLALRYHPDVCDPSIKEESTRMFIELQSTYLNLLDKESHKYVSSESRNKWEGQLSDLKRRSFRRDGSWGSRMRAKLHGS